MSDYLWNGFYSMKYITNWNLPISTKAKNKKKKHMSHESGFSAEVQKIIKMIYYANRIENFADTAHNNRQKSFK